MKKPSSILFDRKVDGAGYDQHIHLNEAPLDVSAVDCERDPAPEHNQLSTTTFHTSQSDEDLQLRSSCTVQASAFLLPALKFQTLTEQDDLPRELTSSPVLEAHGSISEPTRMSTSRKVAFAENLSIYDTFSKVAYDRRGHVVDIPAALARVIREEINTYKMEEMIVHAASHTKYDPLMRSFATTDYIKARNFSFPSKPHRLHILIVQSLHS